MFAKSFLKTIFRSVFSPNPSFQAIRPPFSLRLLTPTLYFKISQKKIEHMSEADFQVFLSDYENQIYQLWNDELFSECLHIRLKEIQLKKTFYKMENYPGFPEDCCKIGVLYNELNDDEHALSYFNEGLKNLPEDESNYAIIADIKHNKGISQMNLGKLGEAIILVEEAKTLKRKVYKSDEDFLSLGITCFNLGNMYAEAGLGEKAVKNYEEAIELFKSGMEINQKECMINLTNTYEQLGSLHFNLKNFEKAREIFSKTPQMFEESFGKTHILVVKSLCNAATIFLALKEYKRAEEHLMKAYKLIDKPSDITWALSNLVNMLLARLQFRLGNPDKSQKYLGKVERTLARFKVEDLTQLHLFYLEKSQILIGFEEYESAFESVKKCLDLNHKIFGNEKKNPALPNIFLVHAKYYLYFKKDLNKAQEFIDQAYSKAIEIFGEFDEITAQLLKLKGTIAFQQKKITEAVDFLKNAEKIFEKNKETSILDLAEIRNDLGLLISENGDRENALAYLNKCLETQNEA